MKLAIFGASSASGKQLVDQALAAGHTITALLRDTTKLPARTGLTIVAGDATDAAKVADTVRGADAVLGLLGPKGPSAKGLCATSTRLIVDAMKQHGVRRVVIVSVAGVPMPQDKRDGVAKAIGALLKFFLKQMFADREAQIAALQASNTDWVVLRLPRLTNDPPTGKWALGYPAMSPKLVICRADLAAAMLAQLTDTTWLKQAPIINAAP